MSEVMQAADWYYDPISPFAYLHLERLTRESLPLRISCKPILLAALLKHHGQLGPAEIPAKRRFTYRSVMWRARELGIPFRMPRHHPFNPLALLRLAILVGDEPGPASALLRSVWAEGRLPESAAEIDSLGAALGIDRAHARIAGDEVKQALREQTDAAIELALFGVPSLVVDGELFWGEDSMSLLRAYLHDSRLFQSASMRRLDQLPIGVTRS